MTGVVWKINRIRAMGGREILHRARQALCLKLEKIQLDRGILPSPDVEIVSKNFLFPCNSETHKIWHEYFSLDSTGLADLIAGRIDFFGHRHFDVGDPVRWHQDPVSGITASAFKFGKSIDYRDDTQVGNIKFLWELGRFQHLVPLAAAYAVTGEKTYQKAVVSQVEDWIIQNDFNRGIHWCSALEVSLRLISLALIHSFFLLQGHNQGLFSLARDTKTLGKSIYQHAWFVAHFLSRYSSANNHLIGELTGLWTGCEVFDLGRNGDKWSRQSQRELETEAKKQVFFDGVNREQSTYYHLWVLEYFMFARLVGLRSGKPFSIDFDETIKSMADFLEAITPKGGVPPSIGDADDGFVTRFEARWPQRPYEEILSAVIATLEEQRPRKITQKVFWYGIIAGTDFKFLPDINVSKKVQYPRSFPDGGYAVLGDETVHLVFDGGTLGYLSIAAHGHADALSFCLAVDGEWWLVDPGTYAYHGSSKWRNYFRGTAAHNTLEIDGKNQSQIGGPFLWSTHAPVAFEGCGKNQNGLQCTQGSHKGYRGIVHSRKITYDVDNKKLNIFDSVTGKNRHTLVLNFHFSPEFEVVSDAPGIWMGKKENSKYVIKIIGQDDWVWSPHRGDTMPISGWYSSNLDHKQPTITLQGKWVGELPVIVETIVKVQEIGER